MKKIIFLVALLCATTSLAGTIDPKVDDSKYLEYGAKHECVLPLIGHYSDPLNSAFKGSCVVINENYILTAAHVVYGSMTQYVIHNNRAYPLQLVAIHVDFDPKKMKSNDIAIGRLAVPLKLDFYPEIYTEKNEKNKVCSIAGYGNTGNFDTGWRREKYDNKKRAGSNVVANIEKNCLLTSVTDSPSTDLEFLIAPGDSGGGLFIDKKLAGIHSAVFARDGNADSDYGDYGCHTRVSDYADWISKTQELINTIVDFEDEEEEESDDEKKDFEEIVKKAIRLKKQKIQTEN